MIFKCFVCNTDLLPKGSVSEEKRKQQQFEHVEHIIPNAIGGKLRSKNILCAKCGGDFGGKVDIALIKHCQNFSTLLDVARDRGENQDIIAEKANGEKISISANGEIKPVIQGKPILKLNREGKPEKIIAKSKQELKMYEGLLKKLFPDFKYKMSKQDVHEKDILNIPYVISHDSYRGACKIAIEFYLNNGGQTSEINHLLSYMREESLDNRKPVYLFYPTDNNGFESKIYHFIHVKGIKEHKILYAYITLFGVSSFFVALNWGNYEVEDIEFNYFYDLLECKEKNIPEFDFDTLEVNKFLGEVQDDLKKGVNYLFREDMKDKFMEKVKNFESIVQNNRTDIEFKKPDIE